MLHIVRPGLDVLGGKCSAVITPRAIVEDAVIVDGDLTVRFIAKNRVVLRIAEGDLGADSEEAVCDGLLCLDVLVGFVDTFSGTERAGLASVSAATELGR